MSQYPSHLIEPLIRNLERLALGLGVDVPYVDKKKNGKGEYEYIPFHVGTFCEELDQVKKLLKFQGANDRHLSFCEVGCGLGTKMYLANYILGWGTTFTGIEITKSYLKVAKKFLSGNRDGMRERIHLLNEDARKHDYSPYDIIYFYSPMFHKPGCEDVLEDAIADTCKKGAVVLAHYPVRIWAQDKRFKQVTDYGYRKVKE